VYGAGTLKGKSFADIEEKLSNYYENNKICISG
jgi:hypothetical protein